MPQTVRVDFTSNKIVFFLIKKANVKRKIGIIMTIN